MPMNDVVADVASRDTGSLMSDGAAPLDDNAPDGEPEPTSMRTPDGLPPYLHIQTIDRDGAVLMAGSVIGVLGMLQKVRQ